jgi:hypothetical protein
MKDKFKEYFTDIFKVLESNLTNHIEDLVKFNTTVVGGFEYYLDWSNGLTLNIRAYPPTEEDLRRTLDMINKLDSYGLILKG